MRHLVARVEDPVVFEDIGLVERVVREDAVHRLDVAHDAPVWAREGVAKGRVTLAHREPYDGRALDQVRFDPPLERVRLRRRAGIVPLVVLELEPLGGRGHVGRHDLVAKRGVAVHE